jgi:hypothetical protein
MSRNLSAQEWLLAMVAVVAVSACASSSTQQPDPVQVSIVVSPNSVQVQKGAVTRFAATVVGGTGETFEWSVQGGSANGTITSDGLYTAPATAGQYAVVATIPTGATRTSGYATVIVVSGGPAIVTIVVSPKTSSIGPGGSVSFAAIVTGSDNHGVTWSVEGGSANGRVGADGSYTAPGSAGTYTVVGTSMADATKFDRGTVTVGASPGGPTTLEAQLARLSRKSIYFGHASVGENIIDGITTFTDANLGPEPSVTNSSGASATTVANALHAGVFYGNGWGIANGDLVPKIAIFESTLRGGVGAVADIAMMKPCFSDFPGRSTPEQAFDAYVAAIQGLQATYPNVVFVHFTSPVSRENPDNVNSYRQAYSALVRAKYRGVEPLFDIAAVESTDPGGHDVLVDNFPAMYPGYTNPNDGGHLNGTGQDVVARALIAYLASLP